VPMLINTSFNIAGEPIVETPEDALWCLLGTGLDFCVLEDRVVRKDDAFATVLNLVPHVTALRGTLEFESEDGRLQLAKPSTLRVAVSTRWGETAHALPASHFHLLDLIDGKRNGWELLERLVPGPGEAALVRELMLLRRLHVVALTRPADAREAR